MRFVREAQCEVEWVKPVLDELELMRLCRSLGMMTSVNPKDFNFDVAGRRVRRGFHPFSPQGEDLASVKLKAFAVLAKSAEGVYCVRIEGKPVPGWPGWRCASCKRHIWTLKVWNPLTEPTGKTFFLR